MAQSADALNAKSVGALKIHGALGCVTCLSGALGRDRSVGPAAGEGAMTDFEDHELAQAICRELLELRARANAVTPVELSVLAAKAELPANWQPDETKAAIDDARTDAWLAICRLASQTANNESRPDKVNTAPLWDVAIDRVQAWVAEEG